MADKIKVVAQLPGRGRTGDVAKRYALELEALANIADPGFDRAWPRSCVNPTVLPRVPLIRWQPYPMERGPNR